MGNTIVDAKSELIRKKWVRQKLGEQVHKSVWLGLTDTKPGNVVVQQKNSSAEDGHTVVFDMSGGIAPFPAMGKETAYGTGETKRKYSSNITVHRLRYPLANGDKFDGKAVGDLTINEHSDSIDKLGTYWN